jgi:asparagine synthase (glutamine-hydrolysing)
MPFFDQKTVVSLLDKLPGMDVGARTAFDQVLMHIVSLCVLQERYGISSESAREPAGLQAIGD